MMKRLPRESMRKQSGAVILTYEIYSILHRITAKIKLIPFLYRIFSLLVHQYLSALTCLAVRVS